MMATISPELALVDDAPGVTRDRREGDGKLGDLRFTLIDTAGLDEGPKGSLTARMQEQTETAIALADILYEAGLPPERLERRRIFAMHGSLAIRVRS